MSIISPKLRASDGHHDAYCTVQVEGVCPTAVVRSSADGTCTVTLLEPHPTPPSTVLKLYRISEEMVLIPRELVEQAASLVGMEVWAVRTKVSLARTLRDYLNGSAA